MYTTNKILLILLLAFGISMPMQSQFRSKKDISSPIATKKYCDAKKCEASSSLNFSTGINATGNVLPNGTVDPEWQVINMPPVTNNSYHGSIQVPKAYLINPYQANWNVLAGAGILSPANVSTFSSNNTFPGQPWRVRRTFCVCEDSKVSFKGLIKADDKGALVLYNSSHAQIFRISTQNTYSFNNPTSFSETHTLAAGSYYFEFELLNTHAVATGFSVSGSMQTRGKVFINGSSSCCPNASITIQKIEEAEGSCNGKLDKNEKPGSGWSFTLLNSSGQAIKTVTTNANGEITFAGLDPGKYTVNEGTKSGFYPQSPSSGSMQFDVKANGVYFATFYNCPGNDDPPFKPCCPPISKNDLSKMLFVSGNLTNYKPSFILSNEFKQRIQAYSNYVMSLDPCLTHVTVEYVLRKPSSLPDIFNMASNTILTRGATVFHKNQSQTTWGQATLSDVTLQGNSWYQLDVVLYGGPSESCPRWNLAEGCEFTLLKFNLMSSNLGRSSTLNGSLKDLGATTN